jgi:hypothetical protein
MPPDLDPKSIGIGELLLLFHQIVDAMVMMSRIFEITVQIDCSSMQCM